MRTPASAWKTKGSRCCVALAGRRVRVLEPKVREDLSFTFVALCKTHAMRVFQLRVLCVFASANRNGNGGCSRVSCKLSPPRYWQDCQRVGGKSPRRQVSASHMLAAGLKASITCTRYRQRVCCRGVAQTTRHCCDECSMRNSPSELVELTGVEKRAARENGLVGLRIG